MSSDKRSPRLYNDEAHPPQPKVGHSAPYDDGSLRLYNAEDDAPFQRSDTPLPNPVSPIYL
ncbi:hypothetical protein PAXRUDRAFT_19413 [Paxillus rubicundulus Ve08.2h10]|uniref:Uncharacterized protein n=1 Tax=Paxillus rubicundulus Ve08.2h10 TaxID=930991 RepID=A0A0D0DCD6_9AGAM|nr:hypothetical protein PAXRUDRAFT_19413 [Paxillus rubicundulus Ve08.2h10]